MDRMGVPTVGGWSWTMEPIASMSTAARRPTERIVVVVGDGRPMGDVGSDGDDGGDGHRDGLVDAGRHGVGELVTATPASTRRSAGASLRSRREHRPPALRPCAPPPIARATGRRGCTRRHAASASDAGVLSARPAGGVCHRPAGSGPGRSFHTPGPVRVVAGRVCHPPPGPPLAPAVVRVRHADGRALDSDHPGPDSRRGRPPIGRSRRAPRRQAHPPARASPCAPEGSPGAGRSVPGGVGPGLVRRPGC